MTSYTDQKRMSLAKRRNWNQSILMLHRQFLRPVGLLSFLVGTVMAQNTFPSSGNVGIGTTTPGNTLTVNGGFIEALTNERQYSLMQVDGITSPIAAANASGSIFGGDYLLRSFWGVSVDLNAGNLGDAGAASAAYTRIPGTSSFTINSRNSSSTFQTLFTVRNSGNVGIGTTTPGAKFEVNGNIALTSGSGTSMTFQDGTVQNTAWNGTTLGGDYAEAVDVSGERKTYEPGDVIVIDSDTTGMFGKSKEAYSKLVAGIYSTKPGLVGRRITASRPNKDAEVPMAMMGIVPTKVSTENGPIKRGDLLVTSSKPGYAMKGTNSSLLTGAVIGKALGTLAEGSGLIEVLVALQ